MIVDFHTHIFSPEMRDNRERYIAADETFAQMYSAPHHRLATAEDLLQSMEEAGVDVSVALGFAWTDHKLCQEHNAYVLEAARASGGRIVPFLSLQPKRRDGSRAEMRKGAEAGARGIGELRPESQGYDLEEGEGADTLAWGMAAFDLIGSFHATEPVGHPYPGKAGLPVQQLYAFIEQHPELTIVAAHWGGGLPFYSLMPEVRQALAEVYYDTAATTLLYDEAIYRFVGELAGWDHILWGSDFPLLSQKRQRELTESSLSGEALELVMGGNGRRLLRL